MKWLAVLAVAVGFLGFGPAAHAESCSRSLDYLMNDIGELPMPTDTYQNLFKVCQETLTMSNVKDAYVLRDGGIAVVPESNSLIATAMTLSRFCREYPRGQLRFITKGEQRKGLTTGLVVLMASADLDSCRNISGGS
jgi:hypothetical protein